MFGTTSAFAREMKFQVAPRIGMGRFHITSDHALSQVDEHVDAFAVGTTFGVVTPIGVMFELGGFAYSNFSLFGKEDRSVGGFTAALGYQFETDDGILITPKLGYMSWKLSDKEAALFHPGPEAERKEEGDDYFWQLTLQKRLGKWFALGLDLRGGATDFGSARSAAVVGTFEW
jgi:hypothetical protein